MDNYDLKFKGSITSVPRSSLHAVPIDITFEKATALHEKDDDYHQVKCLLERAWHAADSSKTHLLNNAKYQQNFSLLLQEVLRSYSHLFTIEETIFLENFATLSDDSQRLFIRLYTRKGPWFRMSNISYSEILDCNEGAKGLDGKLISFINYKYLTLNNNSHCWEIVLLLCSKWLYIFSWIC